MAVSRREFLQTSTAAVSAASLGLAWANRSVAADVADIRVGIIGLRNQGNNHIAEIHRNVVAICDVDEKVLAERAAGIKERFGKRVETFSDFRKLIERKDIDAVLIATPNHTHAWISVAAALAGKHVYVEKPVAHNIWEGRQIVQAARQTGRIMQCGTQSRSSPSLHAAVDFVRRGELGKIRYALGTCYKPRPSIGKLNKPLEIPSSVNYDLWCGPAEKRDLYRPQFHYDWHWDFNSGNGDMGNQGIHQMDIARWFLDEDELAPRVMSVGGRLGYDDAGDTPNTQVVYLDYAKAPLIFETRGLPRAAGQSKYIMDSYRGSGVGVIVQCERGHVFVPSYRAAIVYDLEGQVVKKWSAQGSELGRHHQNWLAAIAANDPSQLNAHVREGHLSSALCHLGMISHRLGEVTPTSEIVARASGNDLLSNSLDRMLSHLRANDVAIDGDEGLLALGPWLELDPRSEQFSGDGADAANELRTRRQRKPHVVPDLERQAVVAAG